MTHARVIPGADRTSRWFQGADDYPNQFVFTRDLEKMLLHSTETPKRSACPGYGDGATAPQVTINPWPGYQKTWQHWDLNRAGRALGNPSSTPVSENKDYVMQAEIIGYSDPALGREHGCYLPELPDEGIAYLAKQLAFIHKEWGIPTVLPSTWPLYKVSSWPAMDAAHMSSSEYDAWRGLLAHLHVPEPSTHGDIAINIRSLKAAIDALLQGDDMPTPEEYAAAVWKHQLTKPGSTSTASAGTQLGHAHIYAYRNNGILNAGVKATLDPASLAQALAPLLAEALPESPLVTQEQLEEALREVLGSVNDPEVPA